MKNKLHTLRVNDIFSLLKYTRLMTSKITDSPANLVIGAVTIGAIGIAAGVFYALTRRGSKKKYIPKKLTRRKDSDRSDRDDTDSSDKSDQSQSVYVTEPGLLDRPLSISLADLTNTETNPHIMSRLEILHEESLSDSLKNSRDSDHENGVEIKDVGYLRPEQIESIIRAKGKEVRMNAPIILRQQFGQKGYAIIQNNLSQTNTKLNEFVELMRMEDLSILNGCEDPKNCKCNFRHKRCRLFIARYNSYPDSVDNSLDRPDFKFFSSTCQGIMRIRLDDETDNAFLTESVVSDGTLSDVDSMDSNVSDDNEEESGDSLSRAIDRTLNQSIKKIEKLNRQAERASSQNLRKLVNLFDSDFTDSCIDIIEYLHYVVGATSSNYTADIIFIADPFYEGYSHTQDNGYGRPVHSCNDTCDDECETHQTQELDDEAMTCCMDWHQDIFCDSEGDCHPYDYVALFVLDGKDITPHQLMIGKGEYNDDSETGSEIGEGSVEPIESIDSDGDDTDSVEIEGVDETGEDSNKMMTPSANNNVLPRSPVALPPPPKNVRQVSSIDLDKPHISDIGYIIDQGRDLFHRHSKFNYRSTESRRNVLAIRFRYYDR
jgi:hypothetical protein